MQKERRILKGYGEGNNEDERVVAIFWCMIAFVSKSQLKLFFFFFQRTRHFGVHVSIPFYLCAIQSESFISSPQIHRS